MSSEETLVYNVGPKRYVGKCLSAPDQPRDVLVILLPDWRGQSGLAREHAADLRQIGCHVVIADLYGDGFTPTDPSQVGPMVRRLLENRAEGSGGTAVVR